MDDQILWAWFAALKGISLLDKHKILKELDGIRFIYEQSDATFEKIIERKINLSTNRNIDELEKNIMDWMQRSTRNSLITWDDKTYPKLLKEIDCPPLCLYVKGEIEVLDQPQVAIVGSRKNTLYGKKAALSFARQLSKVGIVVTSGMALGIDAYAHLGALENQNKTIAVQATGIDKVYPARHDELAKNIVKHGGCLVSEFPLMMPPLRQNFPRRNRIISGLSQAIIVVEAELKSGTLITARLAVEQNREVYALPGSIFSPQSIGCNQLLFDGVKPCVSIENILQDLYIPLKNKTLAKANLETVIENNGDNTLLEFINDEPISIEAIILESQLTLAFVSDMLLELELKGSIIRNNDGLFVRS